MWVLTAPLHTPTLLCLPVLLPFEMGAHMESQSSDKIIFNSQIILICVCVVLFFWTVLWGKCKPEFPNEGFQPAPPAVEADLNTGPPGKFLLSPNYIYPKIKTIQLLKMQKEILDKLHLPPQKTAALNHLLQGKFPVIQLSRQKAIALASESPIELSVPSDWSPYTASFSSSASCPVVSDSLRHGGL